MESLAAGRHSLRRVRAFYTSPSRQFSPSAPIFRRYAFSTTPQRMDAQSQPDTSRLSPGESNDSSQAYPLSGYYSMIMDSQPHYKGQVSTARAASMREGKPSASMQEAKTPQEKMAIVFGTRLAGPGRQSRYNPGEMPPEAQWKTINGVAIPPRPEEPDNCCMSGCVHCVWDDFRDEMEDWAGRVALAKAKGGPLKGTADMRAAPRAEVGSASQSMDDDGGGSDANWSPLNEDEDLFGNIPVGIREFMKTEKKLRTKRQQAEAS